jgi:hypothetical protein
LRGEKGKGGRDRERNGRCDDEILTGYSKGA